MEFRNFLNFFLSLSVIYSCVIFLPFLYSAFTIFSVALVGIKLAEWLMQGTRKYFLYQTVCPKNKAILITGCDTGFGNALAKRMDERGYWVFAACLDPKGEGAENLLNNSSEKLRVLPLDVTDDQSIQKANEFVTTNLEENVLWAVVNNAGIGHVGQIDWTSVEEIQQVYNVNTTGTLKITKAFLPLIKKSKGRIVNTTSLSCRFHFPGFVGYCMSKSAAVALTTGLRIELAKWGVKAISIEPYFYTTPLTGEQTALKLIEKSWKTAPDDIKEEYGEDYKETFKKSVVNCLSNHSNPRISEVIDCLEDAITAKEPLSTYFPCKLLMKAGIKLMLTLPTGIIEYIQTVQLELGDKPAALKKKKEE